MKTRPKDVLHFLKSTRAFYPQFNPPIRYVLKKKWDLKGRIDNLFRADPDKRRHQLYVTERILELPFVHRVLDVQPGDQILEFGCTNSTLSLELASRGIKVVGADLRPYRLEHPNLTFRQGDVFQQTFSKGQFEAIVAVSAIEHVGLGAYGEAKGDYGGDRRLMRLFRQLLSPGGQLIVTLPFGRRKVTSRFRIYDDEMLASLLHGYNIEIEEYYHRYNHSVWMPTTRKELSRVGWSPVRAGSDGLALISARASIGVEDR